MNEENNTNSSARDAEVVNEVLLREARRRRTIVSVSLPICLLIGLGLFSSMAIESIYVVGAGAVAGLIAWASLINLVPMERGSWAYKLLLAGDRTAAEEASMARIEENQAGDVTGCETEISVTPSESESGVDSGSDSRS